VARALNGPGPGRVTPSPRIMPPIETVGRQSPTFCMITHIRRSPNVVRAAQDAARWPPVHAGRASFPLLLDSCCPWWSFFGPSEIEALARRVRTADERSRHRSDHFQRNGRRTFSVHTGWL
jgi:hypothetical protein